MTNALNGYCQKDSLYVWNQWCARRDTLLLFDGGNNTIRVYAEGRKPNTIKLKSLDKSLLIGKPEIVGDTVSVLAMPYPKKAKQMRLAILDAKTLRTIKVLNLSADSIPQPIARIGNIQGNESYKKVILSQTKLRVEFPNSLYNYPYTVKQYTLKAKTPKKNVNVVVNSFFLSMLTLKEINDAPDSTMLEFTNIKVSCPECATRVIDDVHLKIRPITDTAMKQVRAK